MEQLDLLVALAEKDADAGYAAALARGPLAAYMWRYSRARLVPGEECPACGHVFPIRMDATNNHALVADDVCVGMDLTRRHLRHVLGTVNYADHYRVRAIRAGWPVETVQAWIDDPSLLEEAA